VSTPWKKPLENTYLRKNIKKAKKNKSCEKTFGKNLP